MLKVVTAFTVAHSVAALPVVLRLRLPPGAMGRSRNRALGLRGGLEQSSPLFARPGVGRNAFRLVTGSAAGALRNLSASIPCTRTRALAAFNLVVELGQLAIVAVVLPLLYVASKRTAYRRFVLGPASLCIAWVAALWVIERAFGLSLLGRS